MTSGLPEQEQTTMIGLPCQWGMDRLPLEWPKILPDGISISYEVKYHSLLILCRLALFFSLIKLTSERCFWPSILAASQRGLTFLGVDRCKYVH